MRRIYFAAVVGILSLFSIAWWKNNFSYSFKPVRWRVLKSVADVVLVVLSALFMPAILVGWTTMWLTRGIQRRGIQVTLAVVLGIVFSTISGVFLEIMCLLGIFSVDLVTGQQGIYGWWKAGPPAEFLAGWGPKQDQEFEGMV